MSRLKRYRFISQKQHLHFAKKQSEKKRKERRKKWMEKSSGRRKAKKIQTDVKEGRGEIGEGERNKVDTKEEWKKKKDMR